MSATVPVVVGETDEWASGTSTDIFFTEDIPQGSHVIVVFVMGIEGQTLVVPHTSNTANQSPNTPNDQSEPAYDSNVYPDPDWATFRPLAFSGSVPISATQDYPFFFKCTDDAGNFYGWDGWTHGHTGTYNAGTGLFTQLPQGDVESPVYLDFMKRPDSTAFAPYSHIVTAVFECFNCEAITSGQKVTVKHPGTAYPSYTQALNGGTPVPGVYYISSYGTPYSTARVGVALMVPRARPYQKLNRALSSSLLAVFPKGTYWGVQNAASGRIKDNGGTPIDGMFRFVAGFNEGGVLSTGNYPVALPFPTPSDPIQARVYTQLQDDWGPSISSVGSFNGLYRNSNFLLIVNAWDGDRSDTRPIPSDEGWTVLGDWGTTGHGTFARGNPGAPAGLSDRGMSYYDCIIGRPLDKHLQIVFRYGDVSNDIGGPYKTFPLNLSPIGVGYTNSGMPVGFGAIGTTIHHARMAFRMDRRSVNVGTIPGENRRQVIWDVFDPFNDLYFSSVKEQQLQPNGRFVDGPLAFTFGGVASRECAAIFTPKTSLPLFVLSVQTLSGILSTSGSVIQMIRYTGSGSGGTAIGQLGISNPTFPGTTTAIPEVYQRFCIGSDGIGQSLYWRGQWLVHPLEIRPGVTAWKPIVTGGFQPFTVQFAHAMREEPGTMTISSDRSILGTFVGVDDTVYLGRLSRVGATSYNADTVSVGQGTCACHLDMGSGRNLVVFYTDAGFRVTMVTYTGATASAGTPQDMGITDAIEARGFLRLREDGDVEFTYLDRSSTPKSVYCKHVALDGTGSWLP